MRRGDTVAVAGGVDASKPQPGLVVDDDRFDSTDSSKVCPVTTTQVDLLRVPVCDFAVVGLLRSALGQSRVN